MSSLLLNVYCYNCAHLNKLLVVGSMSLSDGLSVLPLNIYS